MVKRALLTELSDSYATPPTASDFEISDFSLCENISVIMRDGEMEREREIEREIIQMRETYKTEFSGILKRSLQNF